MKTKQEKEDVFANLKLLKGTVEEFGKISVTDNYTSHEREQIKSWVKIAAERSEEDSDKVYKIGGDPKKRVTPGFIRHARTKRQLSVSSENTTSTKGYIGLRYLYANVDQLLNKMDDLSMLIAVKEPDIMLFTEVIPKAQRYPILETQLKLKGYDIYTNFNHTDENWMDPGSEV